MGFESDTDVEHIRLRLDRVESSTDSEISIQ